MNLHWEYSRWLREIHTTDPAVNALPATPQPLPSLKPQLSINGCLVSGPGRTESDEFANQDPFQFVLFARIPLTGITKLPAFTPSPDKRDHRCISAVAWWKRALLAGSGSWKLHCNCRNAALELASNVRWFGMTWKYWINVQSAISLFSKYSHKSTFKPVPSDTGLTDLQCQMGLSCGNNVWSPP